MEAIVSAVKSTQSIQVKDNIKQVCKSISHLKTTGNNDQVKDFLQTVNFESAFEKLVAVKLIDAFKLKDNLISAFSTEDLFVVSQSLKCDWFFQDEGNLLSDRNLVLSFFSKLSYSGRCKVIRRYAKKLQDTNKAESIFLLLEEIYGINTALEILSACGESFITDILYSKNVTLPPHVVKQLYNKYPDYTVDFIFSYFEKKKTCKIGNYSETYDKVVMKMASEKTALFIEFYNKYGGNIHLEKFGRSLTRKIIKAGYSSVLRNIDLYMKILNVKLVVSYLSVPQIEEFHLYLLPKSIQKFRESLSYYSKDKHVELLDHVKPNFAMDLVLKNFKKKYGKDPMECKLDKTMMTIFPLELRTKWTERELQDKDMSDHERANFATYLPFERAFETLKSLMPTALDVNQRAHIIACMMKSAKINNIVAGISQVFSFVVAKHRNDVIQVRGRPIDDLRDSYKDLKQLTQDQWAPIIELFNIMTINNEIDNYTQELVGVYEKLAERKLMDNQPIEAEMKLLLKHINYYYDFTIAQGTPYEGIFLKWFNENLSKKEFVNDREKKNYAVKLFCTTNNYNYLHPQSQIIINNWILEIVKEKLQDTYTSGDIIKTLKKNKELRKIIYDSVFPDAMFPEILQYKLNSDVTHIESNIKEIVRKVMTSSRPYSYKTFFQRLLLFMDLPNKFFDQCLKEIQWDDEENAVRHKENGILILSFLGNPDRFLKFVENYYPDSDKAESEGDEAYEKYRLQTAITNSLKNINPPYKALEAIKKFSRGDYLKLVLGSVLSVSLKISQNKALEFIKENLDTPVSYRKHIIRTFRLVAPKSEVNSVLMSSIGGEKNVSIRVLLFNSILDLLKKEKTHESWQTVKSSLNLINETDLKQLECRLFSTSQIPVEYQAEYVEAIWTMVSRLNLTDNAKVKIFSIIDEHNISQLTTEFADFLLSMTYSFEAKEDEHSHDYSWNSYISLYINYSPPEMFDDRLNKVTQLIQNKIIKNTSELNCTESLNNLVEIICSGCVNNDVKISPLKLLTDLRSNLIKLLPEYEMFEIILSLSLHKIYIKNNKADNIVGFADEVCGLVDLNCSTYGAQIIHILSQEIKNFVKSNFQNKNQNSMLMFSNRLITGPTSPHNKIVGVISLPPYNDLEFENEFKLYKLTLDAIKSTQDHTFKIYAKHCINNLNV